MILLTHQNNKPDFQVLGNLEKVKTAFFVIPAKAGIQLFKTVLDSRFRGSDGF